MLRAIETIKEELRERLAQLIADGKLVEAQRLEQRTRFDLEMLQELGFCKGIENYSRHLSGAAPGEPPPTLIDYLPADALMFIDESHVTIRAARRHVPWRPFAQRKPWCSMASGCRRRWTTGPCAWRSSRRACASACSCRPRRPPTSRSTPITWSSRWCGRPGWSIRSSRCVRRTQVDDLLGEIHKRAALQERVLVTTLTKRMAEDLTDFLSEHGVRVRYLHSDIDTVERVEIIRDLRLGVFDVLVGINLLREGLDIPRCRWWPSWMPTRKASCDPSAA